MNDILKEKLPAFPDKPGVYLMKNQQKKIIYIGKARSLKKRVRSYFSGEKDIKTRVLVEHIHDIEHIVTANEQEAILLENNLIKQWKPRFNINLKDGKTYPVIRITNETYPRIFRTRRIIFNGSEYYGPYTNVHQVEIYLKILEDIYPLRKCKDKQEPRKRKTPCLYYHIHRCRAPCCDYISHEEYIRDVSNIRKLLSGNIRELAKEFEDRMLEASRALDFEQAAGFRDQLEAIRGFSEVQRIVDFRQQDRDYIGFTAEDVLASFVVLQMRDGKLIGREIFRTEIYTDHTEALLEFFIQYYGKVRKVPPRIFLPLEVDPTPLVYFIHQTLGKKVRIHIPRRGSHLKLIRMANENAGEDIKERTLSARDRRKIEDLQVLLGIDRLPRRIEGFDISHLAGKNMVGAMVSFLNSKPDKRSYRYFKIRSLPANQVDDYEALREVMARRYTRVLNENLDRPDLILIDGGRGQLNAAYEILQALNLAEIPVISLAKKQEEIFRVDEKNPLVLDKSEPALQLLQAVRDEAHRFGVRLNRRLSGKVLVASILENVKGIGRKKSHDLIVKYGSVKNILKDDPGKIAGNAGISLETAQELVNFLKQVVT